MSLGPSSARVSVPWGSPTVRVVLASVALAPLGVPLISPALPLIRDAFGLTDARASLVVSAYFVTGVALSPPIGVLADLVGRRRVLVPSAVAFGLAGGAVPLAPGFEAILALRVVKGTGAAGIFVATVTLVGDAFAGLQRNAVLGVNAAVLSTARAAYPLLGGLLATVEWRLPFVLSLAGLPVALFAHLVLPEHSRDRPSMAAGSVRRAVAAVDPREAAWLYGSALASELFLFGTLFTALPFTLATTHAVAPGAIGLVVTVGAGASAVAASQNGRLAALTSNERLVAAGFAAYGVGLIGAWLATSPLHLGLAAVPIGAAAGLNLPTVDDGVTGLVRPDRRAGALSVRNSLTFLGRAVGPVLFAGLAAGGVGYRPVLLGAAVAAVAWLGLVLGLAGEPVGRH